MPTKEAGFLKELSARAGFCPQSATIYGRGAQAVVAMGGCGNVFKAFKSNQLECGIDMAGREAAILGRMGGFTGNLLRIPDLRAHRVFDNPFEWENHQFVSVVEQSYMPGGHPYTPSETENIGRTLAELHGLMKTRLHDIPLTLENIPESRLAMIKPDGFILTEMRDEFMRLRKGVHGLLNTAALQPVHGDFVDTNIKAARGKYAVLDFARVGLSLPEQDMTAYANWPVVLKNIFKVYAENSGYEPQQKTLNILYAVDAAASAERSAQRGDMTAARQSGKRLQLALG